MISVEVIKKSQDFLEVISNGSRFSKNGIIFFYLMSNDSNCLSLGLSVKKKAGNAVVRNKIKRQLRELFKKKSLNMSGLAIVVIVSDKLTVKGSTYIHSLEAVDAFISFIGKT